MSIRLATLAAFSLLWAGGLAQAQAPAQETPEQRFERIQRENNARMEQWDRDNKAKLKAWADQKDPKSGLTLGQIMQCMNGSFPEPARCPKQLQPTQ